VTEKFCGRREDARLLTGQGEFTADRDLAGQLHAHFLRADRAHAEIVSIDTAAALRIPGVVAVFTGRDTAQAGFGTPPPMVKYPGRGGMALKLPHRDVLAIDRVRFVGQEVALVVASSALAAQDAAEAIEIEYRDLPAVVDPEEALAEGAPQLHAGIPGNLCFDYEYGSEAEVAAAFARAAHVARVTLESTRVVGNPMEPKSCLVSHDRGSGMFDVYASTQGAAMMRPNLAAITRVAAEKIRIHARDVGGGFGIRSNAYAEYCALMLAARELGRPVKWVGSRAETFLSDYQGRALRLRGELALDRDGRFLALRVHWTVNSGAYLSPSGPLINTLNASMHAVNAYRIPALYGRHRLALTSTTPTAAYRGAARPSVTYLVERLVDEAARESGIDRVALRRRNVIPRDAFPYKTGTSTYDSGDPGGELDEAVRIAEWDGFERRRAEARERGRLRGIGCALFIEPSGGGENPREEAAIRFGESGNLLLYVNSGPSGQGHETVYPEVVARVLGIAPERITLRASDPHGPALMGGGTVGSRSTISHAGALAAVAQEVVRKGLDLAARELEVAAQDVEFGDGRYRVKGTDLSIAMEEIVRRYAGAAPHPLDTLGGIPTPRAFPGGAHVVEVEIDPETGEVEIVRYVAVDDCGTVINHVLVEGQLHGGILQGAAQALLEHCIYDAESGQLLTGSFMDYAMPRSDFMAAPELHDHPVPSPSNPLGAKGVGEAGTTGALPAVANAVIDALRALGIHHLDFPYSPARVWAAIAAATGAAAASRSR
jgi:aerobic carbon-monoxide dehydrogenase large subunit